MGISQAFGAEHVEGLCCICRVKFLKQVAITQPGLQYMKKPETCLIGGRNRMLLC